MVTLPHQVPANSLELQDIYPVPQQMPQRPLTNLRGSLVQQCMDTIVRATEKGLA